ncbi:hypothetical protein [Actinomadura mexicana]|uniref:Uncharacterized protein n=1 Tax=Actinomadura mexicana TaxID=134959 RepID=A0A239AZK7_9ACTN|nr:hypothetical protein [Actinomadura mexicana]SNS00939.1 hypothetical protein SAMN06265355_109308 [Actinomadura mexicana]
MIASIDVGASLTKAAVITEPGAPPAAVRVEGVPEWPTVLVLKRDRSLETGVAARNRGAGRTFRDRYHTGLKQMINRAGALDPCTGRSTSAPGTPSRSSVASRRCSPTP